MQGGNGGGWWVVVGGYGRVMGCGWSILEGGWRLVGRQSHKGGHNWSDPIAALHPRADDVGQHCAKGLTTAQPRQNILRNSYKRAAFIRYLSSVALVLEDKNWSNATSLMMLLSCGLLSSIWCEHANPWWFFRDYQELTRVQHERIPEAKHSSV